ncbi:MAG TPA: cytochrome c oxidase subunit II [Solirubrobacteraceae bacterium]|jgi:cytochrome c oxidase subunit 2
MGLEEKTVGADTSASTGRGGPVRIVPLLVIGVLASAAGIALGIAIDWFPTAASRQAGPIDTLWDVLVIASVPVFVMVAMAVLYSAYKWQVRAGEEELDGPPIHGNTRLEVIWTAVPALLILGLVFYAYLVLVDIEDAKADKLSVRVVGEQFAWSYYYESPTGGEKEIESRELYVPVGRQVEFRVQAKDVIHDFWIPAFRMKIDAVPGITTRWVADTTKKGDYPVVCAELCGLGHATMRSTVHVVEPAEYDAWMAKQVERVKEAQ